MRRALGFVAVVGLGAGLAGVYQPAALAKGPTSARIEGGGQVVRVTNDRALQRLMDVTSFGDLYQARAVEEPARTGPAYVVTYVLGRNAAGKTMEFRQVLYPASSSGSVIYTAPRQWMYGATVRDGWAKSPVNLSLLLRSYGITVPEPAPAPVVTGQAVAPVVAGSAAAVRDEDRRPGWWLAAGLVVLVALGSAGAWLIRRWQV